MLTSLVCFALGFAATEGPTWQKNYYQAQEMAAKAKKPLAVFLGSGKKGWNQLSQSGRLNDEINSLLAANYVCVYIDSASAEGKKLAREFEIPGGLGIVISDRTGRIQAFHHVGELTDQAIETYLARYADPNRVVNTTETNPGPGSHSGSYCPSCANGRCPVR